MGAYVPLSNILRGTDHGIAFHCERGGLEVHLRLDRNARIVGVVSGVVGVEPTAPIASAFDTVLAG